MNSRDTEALAVRIRAATTDAVQAFFDERNAEAVALRKSVKKARKKGVRMAGEAWTEAYDIRVRHYGSSAGRNAEITLTGSKRSYDITQVYEWDKRATPRWNVRIDNQGEDSDYGERHTEDFEGAIQQSIVALLGHGYYHLDDE